MVLYNGYGNTISLAGGSTVKAVPPEYNFGAYAAMLEKNSGATAKAEFKSDDVFGDKMFCGGICANNKIYFAPNTADYILVYDTVNDYLYEIGAGLGAFAFKYTGMVAYKGYLYCIPRGVNYILRIDPVTDEVATIELGTGYPVQPYGDYRDSHHYNGCISDDGYLYSPPAYASDKLLKINMEDFTYSEIDFTCAHSTTWTGCCNIPGNKIVFLGNNGFRVWNCATDSIAADVDAGGSLGIYDMVLDPRDGCLYAFGSNKFVKFDPSTNTYTNLQYVNYIDNTYGTVLGIDGNFYTITPTGSVAWQDKDSTKAISDSLAECSTDGMTVCSAGLVLANDGSIYSVPGNGRLIKVSFEGVTGRLPDYIVSGRYYGKY